MGKVKAYVGTFTMRFGPMQVSGSLMPSKAPDDGPKLKVCSPEGNPVRQVYIDDTNDAQYTQGQLHKATVNEDGTLKYLGKENVIEAKKSDLPQNVMNLTAVSTNNLDNHLVSGYTQPYIFLPDEHDPANVQWYDLLYTMVKESGSVFVGMCNLRGVEGFYKVTIIQNHLAVERQLLPDEVNQFHTREPEVTDSVRAKALGIVSKKTEVFDPEKFRSETKSKLAALANEDHEPGEQTEAKVAGKIDLMEALEGFDF